MRNRRQISSSNKRKGNAVEQVFMHRLILMGLDCVEAVHDSWVPIQWKGGSTAICKKGAVKLPGDIRALGPGFAVLVECKSSKGTLPYSRFKDHQHKILRKWDEVGHAPLIGWHEQDTNSYTLFRYDPDFWKPRASMTLDVARDLAIEAVHEI